MDGKRPGRSTVRLGRLSGLAVLLSLLAGCGETPKMVTPVVYQPMIVGQGIYTVRKGATLYTVARRTGADMAEVMALNPALAPNMRLPAGTQVWLPFPWWE